MEKTWEPRTHDSEGLADYCNEVDEWKAQGLDDDFVAYIARVQPTLLTADVSGVCLQEALKLALQLAGDPRTMFDTLASEFANELESKGVAISDGLNWTMLKPFVRRLMANGSTVLLKELKKNLHASGHRHSGRIGHAFVLVVRDGGWFVHDEDNEIEFKDYSEWIWRVMFVRKVELKA
ncbi:TPA: hypothetical protein N0F65_002287 [Lagenidium giganteum]|uniref:Uncharacterized protein n=1 Tax=Lagenidium giganteum TaxID=4803 RepID=A0AAV2Z6S5_9STRA|nr:TPA: hypothetical protein N0F65_002287 [Lagenidium giganteum]